MKRSRSDRTPREQAAPAPASGRGRRSAAKDSSEIERRRGALEAHVVAVQQSVRSCAGCGLCCTESYNVVQVLPIEGERIARHLDTLPAAERARMVARLRRCVDRYRLGDGTKPRRYTCAFLESDFRCALPLTVKPVACLAFNPITADACDQEPARYRAAHEPLAAENLRRGHDSRLRSIPVAVLRELRNDARD